MDTSITSIQPSAGPIRPEWTISELLEWLSDDARGLDESLRGTLARIEAAVTGLGWTREPATIALIRSLADAARRSPGLRVTCVADLFAPAADIARPASAAPRAAEHSPGRALRTATPGRLRPLRPLQAS